MTTMKRYAYRQDGLAGEIFLDPTHSNPPVALFCFGFPGNIGLNPTIDFLLASGYAVIVPQYPGTYDSDGYYTIDSSIQSIITIANRITHPDFTDIKNNRPIPLGKNPRVTLLSAHSFGCFIGSRAASQIKSIDKVLLLAPILGYGSSPVEYCVLENGIAQLEYVQRARPHTFRFAGIEEWQALFRGERNDWPAATVCHRRILGVVGNADSDFAVEPLSDKFPSISKSILGSGAKASLSVVRKAGHGDAELLTESIRKWIRRELR